MAANVGRNLKLKIDGTAIAGVRTKSLSINREAIDITSDDDDGFRTLLSEAGQMSLDISFDGITKNATLRAAIMTSTDIELSDLEIEYPNGDEIDGTFMLTNLEENGTYNDAIQFSGTLQSSGEWTFTPDTP